MKYIECPRTYRRNPKENSLFLGGGITNCPNWQDEMVHLLQDTSLTLLNPRRQHFDVTDPTIEQQQIEWEFRHLETATGIMFWFCAETVCPIALFEYGKYIVGDKPLFIGHHPSYQRRRDLHIQTGLVRKRQIIHDSLEALAEEIKQWSLKV